MNQNGVPEKEYKILSKLKGQPHIVKVFDYFPNTGRLRVPGSIGNLSEYHKVDEVERANLMTMELCAYGCLFDLIESKGPISSEYLLKDLFLQICKGVESVHKVANHAHLDLKLENILIGDDLKLRLCDFGSA